MKRYKCVKGFEIDNYEDDFILREEPMKIEKDSIWELQNIESYIGGECHLECQTDDGEYWIEISKKRLEEYFIEITME